MHADEKALIKELFAPIKSKECHHIGQLMVLECCPLRKATTLRDEEPLDLISKIKQPIIVFNRDQYVYLQENSRNKRIIISKVDKS